ncbi:MAG: rRNA maturation RNase YbeY [Myxococcales bacterium]|nr:MAG: rRNA maturation RNase YbeY [Myxococcales bacterium]
MPKNKSTTDKLSVGLELRGVRPSPQLKRAIVQRAKRMMQVLGLKNCELSLLLCGDRQIQILNRRYRNKDKATDVLSFPQIDDPRKMDCSMLGDVVISRTTAARQAREKGHSELDEITFLLAHGLLHLLGMDHRTAAEDRRMKARTDMLCQAVSKA